MVVTEIVMLAKHFNFLLKILCNRLDNVLNILDQNVVQITIKCYFVNKQNQTIESYNVYKYKKTSFMACIFRKYSTNQLLTATCIRIRKLSAF